MGVRDRPVLVLVIRSSSTNVGRPGVTQFILHFSQDEVPVSSPCPVGRLLGLFAGRDDVAADLLAADAPAGRELGDGEGGGHRDTVSDANQSPWRSFLSATSSPRRKDTRRKVRACFPLVPSL